MGIVELGLRDGEWRMEIGEWGMGNGEWGMGNGEWEMGNGRLHELSALFAITEIFSRGLHVT